MAVARIAAAVAAVVVCAWFALGVRQARDTTRAQSIIDASSSLSGARASQTASLLHNAGMLNPDSQVDILRGRLAVLENDRPQAVRILEGVVHREPLNIDGWLWLAQATKSLPEIKLAVAKIAELDPLTTRHKKTSP
jgi:predicted Zn-dependent protease